MRHPCHGTVLVPIGGNNTNMSTKTSLAALMIAAAAGATVALLFAPDSGKKTRKKLMKEAESVKDTFAYRLMQAEEEIQHLRDKLGKKASEASASV